MASDETWKKVEKYFKKYSTIDKWGDPHALDDLHLLRLFDFREFIGVPVYVTRGAETSGHSEGSYHYRKVDSKGRVLRAPCATDIIIPEYDETPFDLIMDACRFFTGVGFYPHWQYQGITFGGLHVDSRPLGMDPDGTLNYRESRWMGVQVNGKQEYLDLTWHNIWRNSQHLFKGWDGDLH